MTPCLWTSLYWDLPPEEAVRRVAGLGWPAIELSTEHLGVLRDAPSPQTRLGGFRRLTQDLGLKMDQAHITITVDICAPDETRREADQATVLRDIEVLAALGIRTGVLHPGSLGRGVEREAALRQNDVRRAALRRLATAAAGAGVRLALENGCWSLGAENEVFFDGSVAGLRSLIGEIGSPALGICLDTGHAILEQWNIAEAVRSASDLLTATHIADNDGTGDQHRIPFSYGTKVDWPGVVEALYDVGYQGPFNLEIPGERGRPLEILDSVAAYALDVSRKLLAGAVGPVVPG